MKKRWYDKYPLLSEQLETLKKMPEKDRERIAAEILGALNGMTPGTKEKKQTERDAKIKGLVHKFNNILHIIHGYTQMAMEEIGDNKGAAKYLRLANDAVKRADDMMSLLARGDHGTVQEGEGR